MNFEGKKRLWSMSFCLNIRFSTWNFWGFKNFILPDITAEINPAGITPINSGTLADSAWERPPAQGGSHKPSSPCAKQAPVLGWLFPAGKNFAGSWVPVPCNCSHLAGSKPHQISPTESKSSNKPSETSEINYHKLLILLFITSTIAK